MGYQVFPNNLKRDKQRMINFASLFNQFRMGGGNSSINDLIDTPGTTLDRLLEEESFVNQLKSGNAKMTEFMKYDKYMTLVEYVTVVGPEDDRKRSYKFPLVASDALSSEANAVIDFFFPEKPIYVQEEIIAEKEVAKQQKNEEKSSPSNESGEKADPQQKQGDKNDEQQAEEIAQQESVLTVETPSKIQEEKQAEKQIKIQKKEVEPLSGHLFSYYEGEINYTLAGYVSKIFGSFLAKKSSVVMGYLFDPERFKKILSHIESRSVSELVVKLMTHESVDFLEARKNSFEVMLEKASKPSEVYAISNLSATICEIIEKVSAALKSNPNQYAAELSSIYFKPEIITKVIINVMSDEENVSVYNSPILLTYLTNVPLVLPDNDQLKEDLKLLLLSFLQKALEKLQVTREDRKTLGFGRVKIVEIMGFVLKQNILQCQELVANETQFFPTLFKLCHNYEMNNVLHNEVVKIVDIALSQDQNGSFLLSLLKDKVLLKFLTDQANQDMKIRSGEVVRRSRKGYIGHVVQICRKVQEYAANNPKIDKFANRPEFEYLLENLVNKEVYESNKNLAGYAMNKKGSSSILFMKEQVIQEHMKFLMDSPAPIYQQQPKPINIEHPDLVEAEQEQMQTSSSEPVREAEKQASQGTVDSEQMDPKYWKKHLEYDVDDLMNDL